MAGLGNFFGSFLGYLLWVFYAFFQNYGIAIIIFTILLKIVMFPFSIKQQKSLAANSKLSVKQKELQKKYANDRVKLNEEIQKMYDKEGYNPASGCLPMLIPFPIMIGLYYTVINPLSNALHLGKESVAQAVAVLQRVPGISSTFQYRGGFYNEMEIVRHFSELRPYLTMFTDEELNKIGSFSRSFDFLGLNLLGTPTDNTAGWMGKIVSMFDTNLWMIPVFCLVASLVTQVITMKLQPGMQQQQQGCMKGMMYTLPMVSAVFAMSVPAAVGFYWIISTLTSLVQVILVHIFFSPASLTAKAEAQRVALLMQEEAKKEPLPAHLQQPVADTPSVSSKKKEQQPGKKEPGSKKKGGKTGGSSDSYLGMKK
ncbi:YidC/Oxa1 family membrane protein insertase [Clostridium minihomine]|uniref:YidC/Oxa1 family membrane protein insertase n=1 Tax=Clostridium minihomine TaxID=2045012 RepID=UPI000C76AF50|nr:YidC/Oxa1 family membrane protein insertase [Clostridium minihomine]